jgi:hypothetical protein
VDDLRKLIRETPWWAWVIAAIVLIGVIGAISDSGSNDKSKSETSAATAPTTGAKPTTTAAAGSGSASNFNCRPKGVPQICAIAEQSFDQPLEAFGPVGDKSDPNFYGVDYSFALDDKQGPELLAAQAEAQMAIAYKATAKKLQGQINYVTADAYGPGADPFNDYALLSTSIGSADIDQIAGGASPLAVWRVDRVDPALLNVIG